MPALPLGEASPTPTLSRKQQRSEEPVEGQSRSPAHSTENHPINKTRGPVAPPVLRGAQAQGGQGAHPSSTSHQHPPRAPGGSPSPRSQLLLCWLRLSCRIHGYGFSWACPGGQAPGWESQTQSQVSLHISSFLEAQSTPGGQQREKQPQWEHGPWGQCTHVCLEPSCKCSQHIREAQCVHHN